MSRTITIGDATGKLIAAYIAADDAVNAFIALPSHEWPANNNELWEARNRAATMVAGMVSSQYSALYGKEKV